ncbi:MAG TPA: PDZ domain-containing protein [Vicinamibacterales bacterium]|nr:PDZ domain-containing protein [Vicinamibacterales bacterium]
MNHVDVIGPRRPLSRETRLLLVTILVSLTTLWVLARVRFADRPAPPNPITPVLTQLAPLPVFDQLTSAMFQLQSRLAPLLFGVDVQRLSPHGDRRAEVAPALRIDIDTAVTMIDGSSVTDQTDLAPGAAVLARDPASGLTLLRVLNGSVPDGPITLPPTWSPRQPQSPRYLIASEVSPGVVSGRPLLVGPLEPIPSRVWSEIVWGLPTGTDARPGTFVFSPEGALAGLVVNLGDRLALVPGETVLRAAARLRQDGHRAFGDLGVEVQPLTAGIAASTRAHVGVVVTFVQPGGPAAGKLNVTDVIVGVGDEPLQTFEQWQATARRVPIGQAISLLVQRADEVRTVELTAASTAVPSEPQPLGLSLRGVPRVGVEVLSVAAGSAAAAAGIQPGDLITVFADRHTPTPTEVRARFAAASADRPLMVAVTRGPVHHVLTLEKR